MTCMLQWSSLTIVFLKKMMIRSKSKTTIWMAFGIRNVSNRYKKTAKK